MELEEIMEKLEETVMTMEHEKLGRGVCDVFQRNEACCGRK